MTYILLPGLGRDSTYWEKFPAILQATDANSNIVLLDLPGFGTESHHSSPIRVREIVDDLRARLHDLHLADTNQALVCLSFGGMIALDWLSRYPSDFKFTVLGNSSTFDLNPPWHRLTPRAMLAIWKSSKLNSIEERERELIKVTSAHPELHESIIRRRAEYGGNHEISLITRIRQILAAATFSAPRSVSAPILFLLGEKDRFVNPSCTKKLAKYYQSPLLSNPESGHEMQVDAPAWLAHRIVEFKKQILVSEEEGRA